MRMEEGRSERRTRGVDDGRGADGWSVLFGIAGWSRAVSNVTKGGEVLNLHGLFGLALGTKRAVGANKGCCSRLCGCQLSSQWRDAGSRRGASSER